MTPALETKCAHLPSSTRSLKVWTGALVVGLLIALFGSTEPASAEVCTENGNAKATLLWDWHTIAEARESGRFKTSGGNGCWGGGLYDQYQNTAIDASYCDTNDNAAYDVDGGGECEYNLFNTYWFTDSSGIRRHKDMKYRLKARFLYWSQYQSCSDPDNCGSFRLYAQWSITHKGGFKKNCWHDGNIPESTRLHCAGGLSR